MSVPPIFKARLADHNRHCWFAAAFSVLGAWLAWLFIFILYTGAVLLLETVRTGSVEYFKPPPWYLPVGLGGISLIFGCAALDRWRKRYRPLRDRPIIGFHLFFEVLLLPARLTFAIWDHIRARVVLSRAERTEAWRLLAEIFSMGRAESARLSLEFPQARELGKLLMALQVTDWIDLHRGEDDWFYRVRSDQERFLKTLLLEESEPPVG